MIPGNKIPGNKLLRIILLCMILTLCVGCNQNTKKKEAVKSTAESTDNLTNSLDFHVEIPSSNQVNLSWNQVRDAARYVIVRENLKSTDEYDVPGAATGQTKLAELSAEETSYQDTTVKAGKYYQYNIYVYAENSEQAQTGQEETEDDYYKSSEEIVQLAVEDVYWETDYDEENLATSPSAITVMACFNQNPLKRIEPTGMEIFRGTSLTKMKKFTEVAVSQDDLIKKDGEKGILFVDENVKAGKVYYYQARAYVEIDGKREYGYSSNYLRKSAVLPEGDYSMHVTQKKGNSPSLELSLQSNIKGNAKLQFIGNQFNGLVDYVYRKKNHSYESLSMRLAAYRKGNREWVTYQGQSLCLNEKEKIDFRFVPLNGDETFIPPKDNWQAAEIVLMVKYDTIQRNLHFDLKENLAFITPKDSEKDSPIPFTETMNAYEINDKGNHQKTSVPGVSIYVADDYGDIRLYPAYTKKKKGNFPDGVEIYRSSDNKNFSLAGTVEYPEYGDARYSDSTLLPGDKCYYKARNYIETDNGRIYGKFSQCTEPFYAGYRGGKYKMWLAEKPSAKEQNQIVVGLYSYSLGNPTLCFDYAAYWLGQDYSLLKIKEYSLDGIHWKKKGKKYMGMRLPAKKTVYLKIAQKKQEEFDWEDVDSIILDTILADNTNEYVAFYYYMAAGKMSYFLGSDD